MLKVYYLNVPDWEEREDEFFFPFVSGETVEAALAFTDRSARRRKLIGESMARILLERHFGLSDCIIATGEHGKPYVEDPALPAFFNISHSGDFVVCAVSDNEVGVDIEHRGRLRMEVARRFFHPGEVDRLGQADEKVRPGLFSGIWSVKESYLKYTGTGLSASLGGFEVFFGGKGIWLEKEHVRIPVQIRECMIHPDYRCFVCSASDEIPAILPFSL